MARVLAFVESGDEVQMTSLFDQPGQTAEIVAVEFETDNAEE